MPKITVELDDGDMAELDAKARAERVSPEKIITNALKTQFNPRARAKRARATAIIGGAGQEANQSSQKREIAGAGDSDTPDSLETRQAARRAALLPAFGMWADDDSKLKDGVAYQKAMRSEWD